MSLAGVGGWGGSKHLTSTLCDHLVTVVLRKSTEEEELGTQQGQKRRSD